MMTLRVEWMRGCATALVTPFGSNGEVDEARVRALAERQVAGGVRVLVPCGTTGESVTMSEEEDQRVIRGAVEVARARGAHVIAGASSNSTATAVRYSQAARDAGRRRHPRRRALLQQADAGRPLRALPRRRRSGRAAARRALQRAGAHRLRTSRRRPSLRLAREVENIVAVKEASGNLAQIMEILRGRPRGFRVLSGDDAMTLRDDRARRGRADLGRVERGARARCRGWSRRRSRATGTRRASCTTDCCR